MLFRLIACTFMLWCLSAPDLCSAQCSEIDLLDCDCSSTIGIDQSEIGECDYFTRGRREYEDFCGCGTCPKYTFGLFGGLSFAEDLERTQPGPPVDILGLSLLEGGLVGGAIGRQWNPQLRTEVEFSYARNSTETWFRQSIVGGIAQTIDELPASGFVERYTGMVNLTFDLVPRRTQKPNVYAGVGAGVVFAQGQAITATDIFDVDDPSFAWQFLLGTNFAMRPDLDLYAEYRFLQADNIGISNITTGQNLGDFELNSHDLVFGIRLRR